MALTIKQKTNARGYPKAAEMIEITGSHLLDAPARAIQNLLYRHAHDSGRLADPLAQWELPLATIRHALSKNNDNDRVRASLAQLMSVQVTVHYTDTMTGEPRTLKTHLLDFIDTSDRDSGTPTVRYGLPRRLSEILVSSNRWGRIRSEVVYAMQSRYAIAMYELLCLRAAMERCVETFAIDRFRELLGVPDGSYKNGPDFLRSVVEPALTEINGLSDLGVQIEVNRKHARAPIHAVTIAWWKKEPEDFRAAWRELQMSKIGRKARLRGEIETIEDLGS